MLQGVGPEEYMRYQMNTLSDSQLADFCGNAWLSQQLERSSRTNKVETLDWLG